MFVCRPTLRRVDCVAGACFGSANTEKPRDAKGAERARVQMSNAARLNDSQRFQFETSKKFAREAVLEDRLTVL